ncbi:MAG: right-handed parallel beta-helix repeat-containing protein, partial [Planctomycetota bacterium]
MQGLTQITTLSLTLFSTPLWADVHHVAPGQSIQAAVDAAADGDEIVLDSGLYVETVEVMLKNISIRGAGSDSTVWEPASGAMLESTFSNLVVEGIAFEHGTGASTAGSTRGGALFIQSSTIEVYDCSFYNNRSAGGGAVYLSNADAVVSGCRFDENYLTTGNTGGTTIFSNYATLDVHNSTFEENGWGGSGFAYGTVQVNNGYLFASNCYFNHNQSSA